MFLAAHEWSQPRAAAVPALVHGHPDRADDGSRALYHRLLEGGDAAAQGCAREFLRGRLASLNRDACGLPASPGELEEWMQEATQVATARYGAYLQSRRAGAPRRYFSNRAHALHFLRAAAPTKLVDGAWLYGLAAHWQNPRLAGLIRTYLEELGEGAPARNHVLLYRRLLARNGIAPPVDLDDAFYTQGAIQLALAANAQDFLPEIIGFNLAYEQLPLHLLISACELNELGIDPYYFTLHVTVDNAATGHARQAVQSVHDLLPRLGDTKDFWRRVRLGSQLADAGASSTAIISGFDIESEAVRIFSAKSSAGRGAHSDYCCVAGRSVNDWLSQPDQIPDFLAALEQTGWIRRGEPAQNSRFWKLLQGERPEMFGVFSAYELQVIHDWIRGTKSADGLAYDAVAASGGQVRRPSFRAMARAAERAERPSEDALDTDLPALKDQLAALAGSQQAHLLLEAMGPSQHWTPAGLYATRLFCSRYI